MLYNINFKPVFTWRLGFDSTVQAFKCLQTCNKHVHYLTVM